MSRLAKILSAATIVAGISGVALLSTPAEARVSKQEKALLRKAATECKAEVKGKKLGWRARRKWVKSCVTAKLERHPGVNVQELLRVYPDLDKIPATNVKNPV
ncbi:MAG TPA: hypothetical protein VHD34_04965 [Xanthobacteraceae bacterium]|nr:hypothetical protein [Xanthobacteraceae bacterium]